MRTLILSDIHANLPAFEAVLADAGAYDRLIFLGDLANFGPHPAECAELLRSCRTTVCIMGNHDEQILSASPKHPWDVWSKKQLTQEQQGWMRGFKQSYVIDGHIFAIHGIYNAPDILPNTPDADIRNAFKNLLPSGIDEVWFGHYHYQIDRVIDGITYRCIRPAGHHRDKDTRASYSVYEDGAVSHKRVPYRLGQTAADLRALPTDCFETNEKKEEYLVFFQNAFHEGLLRKDLAAMKENDKRTV